MTKTKSAQHSNTPDAQEQQAFGGRRAGTRADTASDSQPGMATGTQDGAQRDGQSDASAGTSAPKDRTDNSPPRPAARVYRRGTLSSEDTLLRRLSFQACDELDAVAVMEEALRNVADHRYGAIVSGRGGDGKSFGADQAVHSFETAEDEAAQHEAGYVRRQVERLTPFTATSRSEAIRALYQQEFKIIKPNARAGGDEGLLGELVEAWIDEGVVAVVFEEVERLTKSALDVPRDIMAYAEWVRDQRKKSGDVNSDCKIGVLMVGKPEAAERLRKHSEYGQRWIRDIEVMPLDGRHLSTVYAQLLPCCALEAKRRGTMVWQSFLEKRVAPDLKASIRRLEYHVRDYITLCADNLDPRPASQADIPFIEELFLDALKGLAGSSQFPNAA